jgi:DNA-binding PadR family transcriptional regulator
MSLEHAILGFLNYGPFSGYDLKKAFDQSVRQFWWADQSQIYRALSKLAEKNWAEVETVEQETRPDRKVYHITPPGRAELMSWLSNPLPQEESRSANLVQVFFAGQLDDQHAIEIFRAGAAQLRAILEAFDRAPDSFFAQAYQAFPTSEKITDRERFFWMLTLECGYAYNHSMLQWMEGVIHRIENQDYTNELDL